MTAADVPYSFYNTQYGGSLEEVEFYRFRVKAFAFVQQLTGGKADGCEAVKLAVCEVVDVYAADAAGVITSESNNGVSVAYSHSKISGGIRSPLKAAMLHLGGTGLVYQGVCE